MLPGMHIAGKTGTTNGYRDAWFVGYTGNFVAGIWVGNDDYGSTNRMTGGSLPAMTWQKVMAFAHQGIELKSIPGAPPNPGTSSPALVAEDGNGEVIVRPVTLSRRGADALVRLERLMEDASRALTRAGSAPSAGMVPNTGAQRADGFASASDQSTGSVRGN
jgi:penicillin-binding protein 1A